MTGPLIDPDRLRERLADPRVVPADCRWWLEDPARARTEYAIGHVPGAVFLSLDEDLSGPPGPGRHPLPTPAAFAETLGRLGIGPEHTVVVYDDRGGTMAARAWWMLTALGVDAAVLDGGLDAWRRGGGALERRSPHRHPVAWPSVPGTFPGTVGMERLLATDHGWIVVDARAPERHRGEIEPIDPVAGHIPGSVNLPATDNLTDDLRFRSPDVLLRRFRSVGIETAADVVVYCGSGVTACHDLLAMEIAGLGRGLLYPGSWSEWCRRGGPVETHTTGGGPILPREEP